MDGATSRLVEFELTFADPELAFDTLRSDLLPRKGELISVCDRLYRVLNVGHYFDGPGAEGTRHLVIVEQVARPSLI